MKDWVGVVLAAGEGLRMRSQTPKVLHQVCGKPMVLYSMEALRKAGIEDVVLVVAPTRSQEIRQLLGDTVTYVMQDKPLGTGHALLQCAGVLEGAASHIAVMGSDSPLIHFSTMKNLTSLHLEQKSPITLLASTGCLQEDAGRVKRDASGAILDVIEASDDGSGDNIEEVNAGAYCLDSAWLWSNLRALKASRKGEFYLTSLVAMAASRGRTVGSLVLNDPYEAMGVNDRVHLSQAEAILRQRIRERWMREGVTMMDPPSTFIDADSTLGQDTVIYPNTSILGSTRIGHQCSLGPGTLVRDSLIGDNCSILSSVVEESILEREIDVGPFSHLRRGTYLEAQVHIGNFAEVKESRLGRGVRMGHFGYVGDASVGANANLGAGLVTCNFDGVNKNRTEIGEGAFIGSDTMLVAPVKVGEGAATGAGSVVNRDVPPYRLAVGIPARIKERSV